MIFDTVNSSAVNWDAVKESAYPVGLEGGLMHVYENECNFNAIMKSAGISELKYYKECGGDLFVQESTATSGLLDKFISFFKKVKEKILQIVKKFVMAISSFVTSDKTFVKKWKPEGFKNFKDFNFTGYKFDNLENVSKNSFDDVIAEYKAEDPAAAAMKASVNVLSDDELDTKRKDMMKALCNEDVDSDSEFRKALHTKFYGEEKEEFKVTAQMCSDAFGIISNTKDNITNVKDCQKKITDAIDKYCNALEQAKTVLTKYMEDSKDEKVKGSMSSKMQRTTQDIGLAKDRSQYLTTALSAMIGAFKDRNRQCKAICVKALNSGSRKKNESAIIANDGADIFADVEII